MLTVGHRLRQLSCFCSSPGSQRNVSSGLSPSHILGNSGSAPEEGYLPCSLFTPVSVLRTWDGLNRSHMPRGQVGCFVEAGLREPQEGRSFMRSQIPTSLWISIHTGTVSTHKIQGSLCSLHSEVTNTHTQSGWNLSVLSLQVHGRHSLSLVTQSPQSCRGWVHRRGDRECPVLAMTMSWIICSSSLAKPQEPGQ